MFTAVDVPITGGDDAVWLRLGRLPVVTRGGARQRDVGESGVVIVVTG
jgi:hypothetical protein